MLLKMKHTMRITHVIFDMDGTLIDTVKATLSAFNRVSDEMGLPRVPEKALRDAMGIPSFNYYRKVMPGLSDDIITEYARRADEAENDVMRILGETLLFDGIADLLGELANDGVKLVIASTGSAGHVNTALEAAGIRRFFTRVYSDHPDKAETIKGIPELSESGVWLMVGDKRIDADAARHNGIFSIGAAFGYCDLHEREFFDRIVFSPAELLEYIRRGTAVSPGGKKSAGVNRD